MIFKKSNLNFPVTVEKCSSKFNLLTSEVNGVRRKDYQGLMHYAGFNENRCVEHCILAFDLPKSGLVSLSWFLVLILWFQER